MSATVRLVILLAMVAAASAYLRKPRGLKNTRPEMWMSTPQLVKMYGYTVETYTFETSDGYTLVIHRIPASRNGTRGDIPILMGHGLASCSEQWVLRAPPGPAYVMVDAGFDVWMTNYRGSFYSRKHKTLDVSDHDFWDFSWHENGVIDMAESIDFVLNHTGKPQTIVLGHSMSSTALLALLAARPEYNAKVRAAIILAPPANLKRPTHLMEVARLLVTNVPNAKDLGHSEFIENDKMAGLDKPFPQACYKNYGGFKPKISDYCKRLVNAAMGHMNEPLNEYLLQLVLHHYPAGGSIRQMMHYSQIVGSGVFSFYDYGKQRNMELYGQPKPPPYNMTNIWAPSYILYSTHDGTVNWRDAEDLARSFRRGSIKGLMKIKGYSHIDYLISTKAPEEVYEPLLRYMDQIRHLRFDDAYKYAGNF